MIIDFCTRRQERAAERCARVLAQAAGVYALANDEQQGQLALVVEEALGRAARPADVRDSGGRVRRWSVMKAKPAAAKSTSPIWLLVPDGNGGMRDATDDPPSNALAVVSGLTNDVLARVPEHQLSKMIGEPERMKAALTARLTAPRPARPRDDGPEWIDAAAVGRRYSLPKSYIEELARKALDVAASGDESATASARS